MQAAIYICTVGEIVVLHNSKKYPHYNGCVCAVEGIQSGLVSLKKLSDGQCLRVNPNEFIDTGEFGSEDEVSDTDDAVDADGDTKAVEAVAMEIEASLNENNSYIERCDFNAAISSLNDRHQIHAMIDADAASPTKQSYNNINALLMACADLESLDGGTYSRETLDIYQQMRVMYPRSARVALRCMRLQWKHTAAAGSSGTSPHVFNFINATSEQERLRKWSLDILHSICTENSMIEPNTSAEDMIHCYIEVIDSFATLGVCDFILPQIVTAAVRVLNIARLQYSSNLREAAVFTTDSILLTNILKELQKQLMRAAAAFKESRTHHLQRGSSQISTLPSDAILHVLAEECIHLHDHLIS